MKLPARSAVSVCEQDGDEHVGQPVLIGVWAAALLCDVEDVKFGDGQWVLPHIS
jgi:hypothetical protein